VSVCLAVGGSLALGAPALAQQAEAGGVDPNASSASNAINSSSYDRGANVSVRQRPRPDYEAEGIHTGGFMIYPKVGLDVTYDDNIYAVQTGAVGDVIFSEAPEIDIQSTWSRNALAAYVKAEADEYASHSQEDAIQYGAGLSGKYEFGRSTVSGGVDYAHDVLPRSASNNIGFSVHRIPYDYTALNAQLATTLTRVRFSVRVDDQIYSYQNGRTATGAVVFEQDQNRQDLTVTGKAEFAVSQDTAVYATVAGNDRLYDLKPPTVAYTRNNSGYEFNFGANFDLTHLVRGEIQLGYLDQTYENSGLFKPIRGLSALGQIEWFPTQLTTVTAVVSRSVGDAGVPGSAGYLTTNGSLQVDHELLRNLILTANAWAGEDRYNGVVRTDHRYGAGVSGNWLITRHFGLELAYTYSNQRSSGAAKGPSFADNRVSLNATLQY
jgi:hypothetical protein